MKVITISVFLASAIISTTSLAASLVVMKKQVSTQKEMAVNAFDKDIKVLEDLKNRNAKDVKKTVVALVTQSMAGLGENADSICEISTKWLVMKSYTNQLTGDLETISKEMTTATVDETCGENKSTMSTFIDEAKSSDIKIFKMD